MVTHSPHPTTRHSSQPALMRLSRAGRPLDWTLMPGQITKAAFLAGVRCLTEGWRALRSERDSVTPALEWRLRIGREIGERAQRQLGPGRALLRSPTDKAAAETRAALADAGSSLLFEATLLDPQFVARADALRRHGSGWDVIEVKSAKLPDANKPPGDEHLDDLAYTAFVAERAGLPVSRLVLMLINPAYRLGGAEPLMAELDVTDLVRERAGQFAALAPELARALLGPTEPAPALKFACRDCGYFAEDCVGRGVPDPLFVIPRIGQKKFDEYKAYERVTRLPADAKLTEIQGRVARVIRSGQPEADLAVLSGLETMAWPAYYLDFEGVAPAIPWFADAEPYATIPFQYSLHRCDAAGQVTGDRSYLAPAEGDWREALCDALLPELGEQGSIVVYSGYEKRMLNYLATAVPRHAERIAGVVERLFDLEPVVRNGYCHPGFKGRSGIKSVLPVMVPGLDYQPLAIQGGEDAAGAFALMRVGHYDGSPGSVHRRDLLAYCGLDTMAMVRVHQALLEVLRNSR